MAYDEQLAERLRTALAAKRGIVEKKMFGGLAFLSEGRMLLGVSGAELMARVGKALYEDSLRRAHVREMDFNGRPMRGYVFVDAAGIRTERQLRFWLERCEKFVATLPPR